MSDVTPRIPERPLFWSDTVLDLQDFLQDYEHPIYVVGGAVRDAYRHHPIKDLDLATPYDAIALGRKIANRFDGDFYVLDAERDVSRVMVDAGEGLLVVDIARFRGDTLLKDLSDRDFTLNAMAVDLRGDILQLIDPLGGESDLLKKILRRCSFQAISDDPVRGLRAVRQSVQLGARIEPETLKDIRANVANLMETSAERVRDEFFKILMSSEPSKALRIADSIGLLEQIVPEVKTLRGVQQSAPHIFDVWRHTFMVVEKLSGIFQTISYKRTDETAANFEFGMIVMSLDRFRQKLITHVQQIGANDRSYVGIMLLGALLHDAGKPQLAKEQSSDKTDYDFSNHEIIGKQIAEKRIVALRLSNDEKKRVLATIGHFHRPFELEDPSNLELHRFWYVLGEYGVDVCLFALADYLGAVGIELKQDEWVKRLQIIERLLRAYFEEYEQIVVPPQVIDGNELMTALDLKPSRQIGQLLTMIREGQVTGEIVNRDDAIRVVRQYLS